METYITYINDEYEIWKEGLDNLFNELEDKHIKKMNELGIKREEGKIYLSPSKASIVMNYNGVPILEGMCHRNIFFKYFDITATNDIPTHKKMRMLGGITMEEMEHRIEERSGKLVMKNEPLIAEIDDDATILGVIDSIMEDNFGNHYVKEIKTIYGYMAVRNIITGTKSVIPYPRVNNIIQTMIYIMVLGLDYGILKYIDGSTMSNSKSYVIELNEIVSNKGEKDYSVVVNGEENKDITIGKIMERYIRLVQYIKSGQIPPRDCSLEYDNNTVELLYSAGKISKNAMEKHLSGKEKIGDWQCASCEYKDLCMMNDDEIDKLVSPSIFEKRVLG